MTSWHSDPVPDEEPLGFSVEEMPVMGEPFEAERAAQLAELAIGPQLSPRDSEEALGPLSHFRVFVNLFRA